jgi:hypothetical protein
MRRTPIVAPSSRFWVLAALALPLATPASSSGPGWQPPDAYECPV